MKVSPKYFDQILAVCLRIKIQVTQEISHVQLSSLGSESPLSPLLGDLELSIDPQRLESDELNDLEFAGYEMN
jgi:hypothetical protein